MRTAGRAKQATMAAIDTTVANKMPSPPDLPRELLSLVLELGEGAGLAVEGVVVMLDPHGWKDPTMLVAFLHSGKAVPFASPLTN